MAKRKPWPEWAIDDYWKLNHQLYKLQFSIDYINKNCLHGSRRSPAKIERMLPVIQNIAMDINVRCLQLQERKKGRPWPYWVNQAVASLAENSVIVANNAGEAGKLLRLEHWATMTARITICLHHTLKMLQAILVGPAPVSILGQIEQLIKDIEHRR